MGLNFSNGSGSEYLRWMASRSEWVMGTENGPEIVELKKAVFDVATLRTGWAAMALKLPLSLNGTRPSLKPPRALRRRVSGRELLNAKSLLRTLWAE